MSQHTVLETYTEQDTTAVPQQYEYAPAAALLVCIILVIICVTSLVRKIDKGE